MEAVLLLGVLTWVGRMILINILPTHVKTPNKLWLPLIIWILICRTDTGKATHNLCDTVVDLSILHPVHNVHWLLNWSPLLKRT